MAGGGGGSGGGGGGGGASAGISYNRTFQHHDWLDNVDRVQASGDNGFNGRFHGLEGEFDRISATVSQIDGALGSLEIQAAGKNVFFGSVGINVNNPTLALEVEGAIRQTKLYLSGGTGTGWSSLTFNAVHDFTNTAWVWPDPAHASVTLEMDYGNGSGRFEVYTSAPNAKSWIRHLSIDGATGNILLAEAGGNVGIGLGATAPSLVLDVGSRARLRGGGGATTAGHWLYQTTLALDRAFVGMANDNQVGFWGNPKGDWLLLGEVNTGDVTILGQLGTSGYPPAPHHGGWHGIRTWDVEAEGTLWSGHNVTAVGSFVGGFADLAENYACDMTVEPGQLVCLDEDRDRVVQSQQPNDARLVGIVSARPGVLLNCREDGPTNVVPVVLSGRVPCLVVDENGPIRRGNLLTSSSTPGHAMRAEPFDLGGGEIYRPGTIIGKALGSLDSGRGVIEVLAFLS